MSAPTYKIRDWQQRYENGSTNRVAGPLKWVPVPTAHDGAGYRRLLTRPDGVTLFGCWCLILQVAAKCPARGTLADADGPLDAEDIAFKTNAPAELIAQTLELLSSPSAKINWLERDPVADVTGMLHGCNTDVTDMSHPCSLHNSTEQVLHNKTNTEHSASGLFSLESTEPEPTPTKSPSRKQPKAAPEPEQIPAALNTPEFLAAWTSWQQHRRELKKPLTPTATQQQMAKLREWGPAQAIIALNNSIASGWTSLYLPSAPSKPPPVAAPPPKPRQGPPEPAWLHAPDDPEKRAANCAKFQETLRKAAAEAALGREVTRD